MYNHQSPILEQYPHHIKCYADGARNQSRLGCVH